MDLQQMPRMDTLMPRMDTLALRTLDLEGEKWKAQEDLFVSSGRSWSMVWMSGPACAHGRCDTETGPPSPSTAI
jgi:hypothetical protein